MRPQKRIWWWWPIGAVVVGYWVVLGVCLYGMQCMNIVIDAIRYMMGG